MYIEQVYSYYTPSGQQATSRGLFLLLVQPKYNWLGSPIKALVRKVALRQFGHFMMGTARIYGCSITVSGSYGHDGLPVSIPDELYERAQVVVPDHLIEAWTNGGGWNSAGSEAEEMRKWALENLEELRK